MANQFNNFNDQNQNWFSVIDKKSPLFIGGIILILLLIAGGAYYYFYYYQKPSAPIFPSVENGTNPFADIAAGKKPSPFGSFGCDEEPAVVAQDVCWERRAVNEKNAAFCGNIKEEHPFASKDACLNLVAQAKKDKSLCIQIKNAIMRQNCQETVK